MSIQRSGACDQRRRRVLMDEHLQAGPAVEDALRTESAAPCPETVRIPGRRYGDEAASDHQQPLTAIVPKRVLTLIVLLIGGLALIAGVQSLYGYVSLLPDDHWLRAADSWDVERAGGLASWCSSVFLLTASLLGWQIYRLRRHRSDDYWGRYRVWVWVSPLLLGASLSVGTHLHHDVMAAAVAYGQSAVFVEPQMVLTVLPAALWLLVALRLLWEVRESRAAWTSLMGVLLAVTTAPVIRVFASAELFALPTVLTVSSLNMLGHLALLMTVASYSRYVYLDAHGLLAVRSQSAKKARRQRSSRSEDVAVETGEPAAKTRESKKKVDAAVPAVSKPEPALDKAVPKPAASAVGSNPQESVAEQVTGASPDELADATDDEQDEADGLSKSERRRQKKLKRREAARKAA
jgi:hypothetical protein